MTKNPSMPMMAPNLPPPPPPGPAPVTAVAPRLFRVTAHDLNNRPAWANLEMFRSMSLPAVVQLRAAVEGIEFEPGQIIIRQNDEGDEMFLLDVGSVRVSVRGHMHDTHFERVLSAPAVFGEMALVIATPRSATVTAESKVRCLRLGRAAFNELIRKHPPVGEFLTRAVGERLLESSSIQHVGKYRVVGRLGAGAVATVFEAIHPGLQRTVALKMLGHSLASNLAFLDQFQREAQLIANFNHDHIVRVYDTEKAYGTQFIVMEKLTGLTLDDIVQHGQHLAWGTVRRILREVAGALAYSHNLGLLHRDVKPSNVFLTEEDRRVKLLDFGIAIAQDASAARPGEQLFGTPYYMSPEQILGQKLDGRSDLYSLGILAYELMTREVPFDADTIDELLNRHLNAPTPDPREIVPDAPPDLCEFVRIATEKRARDRFASCAAAVDFLKLANELPVVRSIELTTLAISYHPSRRARVQRAIEVLREELAGLDGVAILHAHQMSEALPKE
ncbi:MAG: protein kinase [Deltaproteobacteria bacterium]|nr:protein kinase [Deltaproteobacteria bacterium]